MPNFEKEYADACTRDIFLEAISKAKSGIIHISAHGINDKNKGPLICLALGAEIKVNELKGIWDKNGHTPDLVFLSACETGQEQLAKAFYKNGCKYFIAPFTKPKWKDAATFLTLFYRLFLGEKHKTPWLAFKATEDALMKAVPKFSGNWCYYEKGENWVNKK